MNPDDKTEKLRVLIVAPTPTLAGGIPAFATALRGYLSAHPEIETQLLDETSYKGYVFADNPNSFRLVLGSTRTLVGLVSTIRRFRPHVVHLNPAYGRSFFEKSIMAFLSRICGVPAIVHLHGSKLEAELLKMFSVVRRFLKIGLRSPNHSIVLSQRMLNTVAQKLRRVKTTVIPTSVWMPESSELRIELPIKVGFLGVLNGRKGEQDLVRAMALCEDKKFELLIAGGGPNRQSLEALVKELGLSGRVKMLGKISDEEKKRFFQNIHLFCFPSHAENLPAVLLEAMSYGRPVVTTPVGGVAEMVREGIDGWLVPVEDPKSLAQTISEVLLQPEEILRRGRSAKERVESHYTWNINGPKYVHLYRSLSRMGARTDKVLHQPDSLTKSLP